MGSPFGGPDVDYNADGYLAGVLGGYRFQFDQIVLGIEADVSFGDVDDTRFVAAFATTSTQEIDELYTVRGQLGYAFENLLVFVTAGVGFAERDANFVSGFIASQSESHVGVMAGGALEWAVDESWRLRGEYLFGSFDTQTRGFNPFGNRADFDMHIVRGALVWKLPISGLVP